MVLKKATRCNLCLSVKKNSKSTMLLFTIFRRWLVAHSLCQCYLLGGNDSGLYAAVNGQLELTLLKGRQRFDTVSTSNLKVYKFREWWIFTLFIFGRGESLPNKIQRTVNLERTCVLFFYHFVYLKVNLDLK